MAILYLTGVRGSGKTTVGQYLAQQLGCPFVDLDEWVAENERKTVAEIVAERQWQGFREVESYHLGGASEYLREFPLGILATGGGIVELEENRVYLRANGQVIWLKAHPAILEKRLSRQPRIEQRPSLTGRSLLEEVREICERREPWYRECCHHMVDASLPLQRIYAEICNLCHL